MKKFMNKYFLSIFGTFITISFLYLIKHSILEYYFEWIFKIFVIFILFLIIDNTRK